MINRYFNIAGLYSSITIIFHKYKKIIDIGTLKFESSIHDELMANRGGYNKHIINNDRIFI